MRLPPPDYIADLDKRAAEYVAAVAANLFANDPAAFVKQTRDKFPVGCAAGWYTLGGADGKTIYKVTEPHGD